MGGLVGSGSSLISEVVLVLAPLGPMLKWRSRAELPLNEDESADKNKGWWSSIILSDEDEQGEMVGDGMPRILAGGQQASISSYSTFSAMVMGTVGTSA